MLTELPRNYKGISDDMLHTCQPIAKKLVRQDTHLHTAGWTCVRLPAAQHNLEAGLAKKAVTETYMATCSTWLDLFTSGDVIHPKLDIQAAQGTSTRYKHTDATREMWAQLHTDLQAARAVQHVSGEHDCSTQQHNPPNKR